jgi:hypothetical protein
MNRWICWIVGRWRTFKTGIRFIGCDLTEIEVVENATVVVSKCDVCGKYSISWERR